MSTNRLRPPLVALILFAVAVVAYSPSLRGAFIWDDDDYVVENVHLRSGEGLSRIWLQPGATPQYYPLTFTTFWIEWHLWGAWPTGYKLTNLALHCLNAFLIYRVLRRLDFADATAALAAAIFLLHPVCVESVAWITERKNALSLACALLAILAYLRFNDPRGRRWSWWVISVVLFCCALAAKTVTASLPAVLLVLTIWKHGRVRVRDVAPLLPMFALSLLAAITTSWMEHVKVGASGPVWVYGPTYLEDKLARVIIAGRAVWFYLSKLLVPTKLVFIYERWPVNARQPSQYLFTIALIAMIVALWKLRRRISPGPFVAMILFVGILFPALSFVNVYPHRYSFVADHFQYHASIPIITLLACAAVKLVRVKQIPSRIASVTTGAALLILAGLTWSQAHIYHSPASIWLDTLAQTDARVPIAAHNYGVILRTQGQRAEAEGFFRRTLELEPTSVETLLMLGLSLHERSQPAEAVAEYRKGIALEGIDPAGPLVYAKAYHALAEALIELNDTAGAIAAFRESLKRDPKSDVAHQRFGEFLLKTGDVDAARTHFVEALRLNPNNPVAQQKLKELSP